MKNLFKSILLGSLLLAPLNANAQFHLTDPDAPTIDPSSSGASTLTPYFPKMAIPPGQPGYDPTKPQYKPVRTIYLRAGSGNNIKINLQEAYEPYHYDYMMVYGPKGPNYLASRCSDRDFKTEGKNSYMFIQYVVNSLCGNL